MARLLETPARQQPHAKARARRVIAVNRANLDDTPSAGACPHHTALALTLRNAAFDQQLSLPQQTKGPEVSPGAQCRHHGKAKSPPARFRRPYFAAKPVTFFCVADSFGSGTRP